MAVEFLMELTLTWLDLLCGRVGREMVKSL